MGDLTEWSGSDGTTYFYQSELPYDVTSAEYATPGYVGFRVNASGFSGYGVGVYCYFRDYTVTVEKAFLIIGIFE